MKNTEVKKRDKFSRQKVVNFFCHRYGKSRGISMAKKYRRLKKYRALGRYKEGIFYCKAGRSITPERVTKYEAMCHKLARKFFPALMVNEAAYTYDDIVMFCRIEVFLALLNGFDPVKAMTSNEKDPILHAEKVAAKLANPEATLDNSEKSIVYGRLKGFLRRTSWKFHPDQRGGITGSLEYILKPMDARPSDSPSSLSYSPNEYKKGIFTQPEEELSSVLKIKNLLIEVMEDRGEAEAKALFAMLPDEEREAIVASLRRSEQNIRGYSEIAARKKDEEKNEETGRREVRGDEINEADEHSAQRNRKHGGRSRVAPQGRSLQAS